ncbi:MAG: response regulator [Armatimonadetes bacterium]|nr:response regulator [Armatimonadota bacterium]
MWPNDGPAALKMAGGYRPDVALIDMGLPGMDGYEVATHLRRVTGLGNLSLVAVTGYGQDEDRERARAAGFAHHLLKPVDLEALRRVLERDAP